jgi:nucleolar protein 58
MVATKAALSIRVDALTDADGKSEEQAPSIGIENRAKLESRLRALEHQGDLNGARRFADGGKKQQRFEMTGDTKIYNTAADAVDLVPTQRDPMEIAVKAVLDVKEEKRKAKEERRAKKKAEKEAVEETAEDLSMDVDSEDKKSKKEKKRKRRESEVNGNVQEAQEVQVSTDQFVSLA